METDMKKVLCENNHYYDADTYASCPHCAKNKEWEKTHVDPEKAKSKETKTVPTVNPQPRIGKIWIIVMVATGLCVLIAGICIWGFQPKMLDVTFDDKNEYYVGDSLDVNALHVEMKNNFGISKIIEEGYNYSPQIFNTTGNQIITVSYKKFDTQIAVNVNETVIKEICIKTPPTKTSYYIGDKINIDGLTLEVTYNNGEKEIVDSGISLVTEEFSSAGNKKIVMTYADKLIEYEVSVSDGSELYPFEQTYWVIFTEGFRNDRVEASTIDSTLSEDKLHIVWSTSLELNNKSGASKCLQYYLDDNNKWVSIGDYHLLSSKATNVIASNLDIYDKNGKLILEKSQYKDIDWDVIDSYKN